MRAYVTTLFLSAALTVGCGEDVQGPEGPQGPAGEVGPAGEDGEDGTDGVDGSNGSDLVSIPPDDVVFSVAVTNESGGSHRGAAALNLVFDGVASSPTDVVASHLDRPPIINGGDGGVDEEWGGFESAVVFDTVVGTDNKTTGATVRAGYDDHNVYFFVQWDEDPAHPSFGESYQRKKFTYDGSKWSRGGNEDRIYMMFPITEVADWEEDGCTAACHGSVMHAANKGELLDVWHYKHARTGPTQTSDDKVWDVEDRKSDQGISSYVEPKGVDGGPAYMYAADPGANMDYPVNTWEMIPFVDAGFVAGDTIPGVINRTPTGSRADVTTVCKFATPTWTCEFKRARDTGNGDDHQF